MSVRCVGALLLALTSGCFSDHLVEPVWEIEDEAFVVVSPFHERGFPSAWDSPHGHESASLTTSYLESSAAFETVPYREVLALLTAKPSNDPDGKTRDDGRLEGLDVDELTPADVAEFTGAEYVVVCELLKWQLKDPKSINLTQATAVATVRLFRVAGSDEEQDEKLEAQTDREQRVRRVWEERGLERNKGDSPELRGHYVGEVQTVTARYPEEYLQRYGEVFLDPSTLQDGLYRAIGRKVAQLFYTHEERPLDRE